MSLIEEALRRLQDPLIPAKPSPPPSKSGTAHEAPPAHSWPTTPSSATTPGGGASQPITRALIAVAAAIIALTVALFTGAALWWKRSMGSAQMRSAASTTPMPTRHASPPLQAPQSVETAGTAPSTSPPKRHASPAPSNDLVISGVVEGLGEPYAVINGAIVRAGEQVNDATLLRIADGVVVLRRADGTEMTLQVPR